MARASHSTRSERMVSMLQLDRKELRDSSPELLASWLIMKYATRLTRMDGKLSKTGEKFLKYFGVFDCQT